MDDMENRPHEYKETPGPCTACGNSPVNHTAMYVVQTFNVWLGRRLGRKRGLKVYARFMRWGRRYTDQLVPVAFTFGRLIGCVSFAHDPLYAASYRSQVIWEEAIRRKIPMEQTVVFGTRTDMYRAYINGAWFYFESLPIPPEIEQGAYEWMSDKFLLKEVLREAGVPTPRAYSVASEMSALGALEKENGGVVVVKPQAGSRGRHTTTFIRTPEDVIAAFRSARALCAYVAIEEQLTGGVSRATIVDGKLVGFFTAEPPRVTGDGKSTIHELVARKNATKHERVSDVLINDEHINALRRQGYTLDSVPAAGLTIDLTHRTGRLLGGETRELLDTVHPKLKEYVQRAACALNVPVVGFDLIIPDPERDPDAQHWGVIEANGLPFIDLHYLPLFGTPSHTAGPVWDLWKRSG